MAFNPNDLPRHTTQAPVKIEARKVSTEPTMIEAVEVKESGTTRTEVILTVFPETGFMTCTRYVALKGRMVEVDEWDYQAIAGDWWMFDMERKANRTRLTRGQAEDKVRSLLKKDLAWQRQVIREERQARKMGIGTSRMSARV